MGHNYVARHHIGHNCIGNNYTGHNYTGRSIGQQRTKFYSDRCNAGDPQNRLDKSGPSIQLHHPISSGRDVNSIPYENLDPDRRRAKTNGLQFKIGEWMPKCGADLELVLFLLHGDGLDRVDRVMSKVFS